MVKVTIEEEECYKCGYCMLFSLCPDNAISRDDNDIALANSFFIESAKCTECLECVAISPCDAFLIELENGKKIKRAPMFDLKTIPNLIPVIKNEKNAKSVENTFLKKVNYITNEEFPKVEFNYLTLHSDFKDNHITTDRLKIMLLWGGSFEVRIIGGNDEKYIESKGEQTFVMIPPTYSFAVNVMGNQPVEIVEICITRELISEEEIQSEMDQKSICRKESEIVFEDGPISKYGKYITRNEVDSLDFQYLVMKPNSEDAHVHDHEVEIMLLWGGEHEVWTKGITGTQIFKSNGEQTCIMVPPGYAHGVKTANDPVNIAITYIPAIDKWP
ncbi:hypothetical protein D3C74_148940 [compost metagenome]